MLISDVCPPSPGSELGRMPSGEVLPGVGIATFQGVGPDLSAPSNLSSTTTDPGVADKAGADKAGPTKQKETPPQPFNIGEGLPAVPMKLVTKSRRASLWTRPGGVFWGPDAKQGQLEVGIQSAELAAVLSC